jgi:hypothetical protein
VLDEVAMVLGTAPAAAPYRDAVLTDSPLAYWRLDETGGTVAVDQVGRFNGDYVNAPTLGVPGALREPGTAVFFGGATDALSIADTPDLRLNGSWTIEFWAKLTAASSQPFPGILSKGNSMASGWLMYYHPMLERPVFKRNNIDELGTDVALSHSDFTHYVLSYDGSMLRWYVNGAADRVIAVVLPPCTDASPVVFGEDSPDNDSNLTFDEIALYAAPLPLERVKAHYAAAR